MSRSGPAETEGMPLAFAVPGRLGTLTGGFLYDRWIVEGLRRRGRAVELVELPDGFPFPSEPRRAEAEARLATLPDGRPLVVDGLAAGVLPEAMAALGGRLPLTLLVHHPLAAESGLAPEQVRALRDSERSALTAAQRVVTTSGATAETLGRDYAVPAERLRVVPPGTTPAPLALGGDGRCPHLLCVGSLIPRKGQDLLIEALAPLAGLPWRLTLAGAARDPGFAAGVEARATALGLAGRVAFPGELEPGALAGLYASADLYLQPSRLEGYGMAIAEALARGLPVLCSARAAIVGELPPDSVATVPAGEREPLTARLADLLESRSQRRSLAAAARRARDLLPDWPAAAERFESALAAPPEVAARLLRHG
ncbi:Glycosyltransferase involved in cell wall bisynthesis [Tistlia consotensis]|uniref:Glycosyltransferase involved in cell wall bisynthesis n=1 Tax=Tistlia consotensis USBA 355 TaxID=560819 RepID=A0A1Y6BHU1_9PROT|nr:glycosyltransferase family 4 protein [Tistlia consotensis]SMF11938.1 Glycosyltransferase involved in cell wall bisynthesis [Tistlia consotensis USBA 355]SNR51512.1 Glycosyltransferase involved in cell wall bisynthesis [Tistlia consotensis]